MDDAGRTKVAVIGAGTMGVGIAQTFARAGFRTALLDTDPAAIARAQAQLQADLALFDELRMLDETPAAILARIRAVAGADLVGEAGDAGVVIETIPEKLEAKRALFAACDALPPETLLATNTSSFTVSQLTAGMKTARRVVGLHYFNPPHIIPAVEVHSSAGTAPEMIERARELMLQTGKVPVLVRKEIPGFIINRLTGAIEREVDHLLDEGVVSPQDLDAAVKASLGFRLACLGPMEAEDMIGLDIAATVSANLFPGLSARTTPSPSLLRKVEAGELGIKSSRGWYDYTGRTREEILAERNRRLLEQLKVFRGR